MAMMTSRFLDAAAGGNPVGVRIAQWIRPYEAKELANLFGVEPRTAQTWRRGNMPQGRALVAMTRRWGAEFLEFIFAPVLAESDLDLEARLESIERQLATLRGEIRETNFGKDHGAGTHLGGGTTRRAGQTLARQGKARVVGIVFALVAVGTSLWPHDDTDMVRVLRTRPAGAAQVRLVGRQA